MQVISHHDDLSSLILPCSLRDPCTDTVGSLGRPHSKVWKTSQSIGNMNVSADGQKLLQGRTIESRPKPIAQNLGLGSTRAGAQSNVWRVGLKLRMTAVNQRDQWQSDLGCL